MKVGFPFSVVKGLATRLAIQLAHKQTESGQGIWIIKLKDENYCKSYGERSCEDGEKLLLMEANDNHEEEWSEI